MTRNPKYTKLFLIKPIILHKKPFSLRIFFFQILIFEFYEVKVVVSFKKDTINYVEVE